MVEFSEVVHFSIIVLVGEIIGVAKQNSKNVYWYTAFSLIKNTKAYSWFYFHKKFALMFDILAKSHLQAKERALIRFIIPGSNQTCYLAKTKDIEVGHYLCVSNMGL